MQKSIFFNNKFAVCAAIIIIVLSFFLGGAKSLNAIRGKAVNEFENGSGGQSAEYYIESVADIALGTFYSIAKNHVAASDGDLAGLSAAANAVKKSKTVGEYYDRLLEINTYLNNLSLKIDSKDMTDVEKNNWNNALSQCTTASNNLKHDDYNAMAQSYNDKLSKVPANFIKITRLAKALPLFTNID